MTAGVGAAAPRAPKPAPDDVCCLDGPTYSLGGEAPHAGAHLRGSVARAAFMVRRPRGLVRYLRLLRRIPVTVVQLSSAPAGAYLSGQLAEQSWLHLGSYAVLTLPDSMPDYLRGRARQAVRTNLHRAAAAGLVVSELPVDERADVVLRFERDHPAVGPLIAYPAEVTAAYAQWWKVEDQAGVILALAYAVVDERTAVLRLLTGSTDLERAYAARYLVHAGVVSALIERGVRWLLVDAMVAAPPGHRYFAARLGYRAARIAWESAPVTAAAPVMMRRPAAPVHHTPVTPLQRGAPSTAGGAGAHVASVEVRLRAHGG